MISQEGYGMEVRAISHYYQYLKENFWTDWYVGDIPKVEFSTNPTGTSYGFLVDQKETRETSPTPTSTPIPIPTPTSTPISIPTSTPKEKVTPFTSQWQIQYFANFEPIFFNPCRDFLIYPG